MARPETTASQAGAIQRLVTIKDEVKALLSEAEKIVSEHHVPFTFYIGDIDASFRTEEDPDNEGNSGWVSSSRYC